MAQKVHIVFEDDLDGTEYGDGDGETVKFALDGTDYEIDLHSKNAKDMRSALSTYVTNARRLTRNSSRRTPLPTRLGHSAREIRDWARSNDHEVPERGRIPADVKKAFEAAH